MAQLPCGRPGFDPWVGKIPWRKERLPTPVFWPGEFRELYRPWGCKESDTTERLSLQTQVALEVNDPPANAGDIRDVRDTGPWVSESPWRRNWQPTPVSCLENPMDRGAWRATVHGVAKSRTRQ